MTSEFVITIIDDMVSENCAENFIVIISSNDERVNVETNMAVFQIDDDDGVLVLAS